MFVCVRRTVATGSLSKMVRVSTASNPFVLPGFRCSLDGDVEPNSKFPWTGLSARAKDSHEKPPAQVSELVCRELSASGRHRYEWGYFPMR